MTSGSGALLGACLALPLVFQTATADAAQPEGGRFIYVPPGTTAVILPGPSMVAVPGAPTERSISQLIAQQD
jgi:hypothetical protein